MKPYSHAKNSVKRYGGSIEDYLPVHDWFDSSKATYADTRHRAVLHHSFGIYLAEQLFGHIIVNSDGKEVHVRNVAEDHVIEDCGFIPTVEDWMGKIQSEDWMRGNGMKKRIEEMEMTYD